MHIRASCDRCQRASVQLACRSDGYVVAGLIDCAPDDASRWTERPFAGRDVDADGTAVAASGEMRSGEELPTGYLDATPAGALDRDDGDADVWRLVSLFDDRDADGYGNGAPVERCIGGTLPDGQAPVGGDCEPNSPEAWALLDYTCRDVGQVVPERHVERLARAGQERIQAWVADKNARPGGRRRAAWRRRRWT